MSHSPPSAINSETFDIGRLSKGSSKSELDGILQGGFEKTKSGGGGDFPTSLGLLGPRELDRARVFGKRASEPPTRMHFRVYQGLGFRDKYKKQSAERWKKADKSIWHQLRSTARHGKNQGY